MLDDILSTVLQVLLGSFYLGDIFDRLDSRSPPVIVAAVSAAVIGGEDASVVVATIGPRRTCAFVGGYRSEGRSGSQNYGRKSH